MRFELAHSPMPAGYGEALLPLELCKAHLAIEADETENDALIEALRDAAIEFVERYCSVKLGPVTGMVWHGEALPRHAGAGQQLGVWPVTAVTAVDWRDRENVLLSGLASDYRVSEKGLLRPAVGAGWPTGVAGAAAVTFDAGFAAGEAPPSLLHAARLMLGHLYTQREAVISGMVSGEAPLGVTALCMPFRPVSI